LHGGGERGKRKDGVEDLKPSQVENKIKSFCWRRQSGSDNKTFLKKKKKQEYNSKHSLTHTHTPIKNNENR